MPLNKSACRGQSRALWHSQALAVESEEPFVCTVAAKDVCGNQDRQVVVESNRTPVECPVVQDAQGESVLYDVGTAGLTPFDMRCKAEVRLTKSRIVATNGASVFVCLDYRTAESGISGDASRGKFDFSQSKL